METDDCDDRVNTRKKGFWAGQFQQEATRRQRRFDWIFGVVTPVVCFFLDPGVFSSAGAGDALLGTYKPFAFLISFTSIIAMTGWLLLGERLKQFSVLFVGLFFVGGCVALTIGVILLPFSLVGLLVAIGALGLTPLFTGIIYLRNGVRVLRTAKSFVAKNVLAYSVVLSALASVVVPYVVNTEINRSVSRIKTGDASTIRWEGRKLWLVSPLVNANFLLPRCCMVPNYATATDEDRAKADVYRDLTGREMGFGGFGIWD